MDNGTASSIKKALESKYRAENGQAEIPVYVVIDYGDGDVLGAHFDKAEAEASQEDIVEMYTLTEVVETSVSASELMGLLAELKPTLETKSALQIEIVENINTGVLDVLIDGVNFGVFDDVDKGTYCYFPKRNDRLTGNHYLLIGAELNKLNSNQPKEAP